MRIYFHFSLIILVIFPGLTTVLSAQNQSARPGEEPAYVSLAIQDQDSVYIAIDDDFDAVFKIASGDTLILTPGARKLRIIKMYYLDLVRTIEIEEGEFRNLAFRLVPFRGSEQMSRRSSYPRIYWKANHFILSDPETVLYIDGQFAGMHYATVDTSGSFEVRGIHASGKEFNKSLHTDRESTFHFHQNHLKPSRKNALLLSFLPGASQKYKKQRFRAVVFSVVTLSGAALAYSYETRYQDINADFERLNMLYRSANKPEDALRFGNEAQDAFNESARLSGRRNNIIYGTLLVYALNIIDGFIPPSIGYRDESRKIDPYLDFDPAYRQPVIGIKSSF